MIAGLVQRLDRFRGAGDPADAIAESDIAVSSLSTPSRSRKAAGFLGLRVIGQSLLVRTIALHEAANRMRGGDVDLLDHARSPPTAQPASDRRAIVIAAPAVPVNPTVTTPISRAAFSAAITFGDLPEVVMPMNTSPLPAEPAHLTLEHVLVAVIVADRGQHRRVGRQRDGRQRIAVEGEARPGIRRRYAGHRRRCRRCRPASACRRRGSVVGDAGPKSRGLRRPVSRSFAAASSVFSEFGKNVWMAASRGSAMTEVPAAVSRRSSGGTDAMQRLVMQG